MRKPPEERVVKHGWRKKGKYWVPRKKAAKSEGFMAKRYRRVRLSQLAAFYLLERAIGGNPRASLHKVHDHVEYPAERIEFDGQRLIRTLSAFHYISDNTYINGLCRSFNGLNVRSVFRGNEKVPGMADRIAEIFGKRYWTGRIKPIPIGENDLDFQIRLHKVYIKPHFFYIVQVQSPIDDSWSMAKLFRNRKKTIKLHKLPLKLSQEEMLDRIESGVIEKITKLGDPKHVYDPNEILKYFGRL